MRAPATMTRLAIIWLGPAEAVRFTVVAERAAAQRGLLLQLRRRLRARRERDDS